MKKQRIFGFIIRLVLFVLVLGVGTLVALRLDETAGLALSDLPEANIEAVAALPDRPVIYAHLTGGPQTHGFYRSEDGGQSWRLVGRGLDTPLNSLAVDPHTEGLLYAGTAGGPLGITNNVWRSVDGGQSWHNFNLSLPSGPDRMVPAVTAVLPDPNQAGVLYVGTDGQGVYRFFEKPLGFELVGGLDLYNSHVKQLTLATDGQLYAVTNGGLFVTTGESWHKIESLPEAPVSVATAPSDPQVLYVGTTSTGLYRSTDGGQQWERISAGLGLLPGAALRVTELAVDPQNADRLVVSTAYGLGSRIITGGIYESSDGGSHWSRLGDSLSPIEHLSLSGPTVRAVTAAGLVRYGASEEAAAPARFSGFESLTSPSGVQILVLLITVGLAVLVVISHLGWVAEHRQTPDYIKAEVTK